MTRAASRCAKQMAGLPDDYWSATMEAARYTADELGAQRREIPRARGLQQAGGRAGGRGWGSRNCSSPPRAARPANLQHAGDARAGAAPGFGDRAWTVACGCRVLAARHWLAGPRAPDTAPSFAHAVAAALALMLPLVEVGEGASCHAPCRTQRHMLAGIDRDDDAMGAAAAAEYDRVLALTSAVRAALERATRRRRRHRVAGPTVWSRSASRPG